MSEVKQLLESLGIINEDSTVPKNVREKVKLAIEALNQDEGDMKIKANKALQELDDISDDPNVPSYVKPQIWNIVSMLESF